MLVDEFSQFVSEKSCQKIILAILLRIRDRSSAKLSDFCNVTQEKQAEPEFKPRQDSV